MEPQSTNLLRPTDKPFIFFQSGLHWIKSTQRLIWDKNQNLKAKVAKPFITQMLKFNVGETQNSNFLKHDECK